MPQTQNRLTLAEFMAIPKTDVTYELVDGEAVAKMSPKRFHSRVTGILIYSPKLVVSGAR